MELNIEICGITEYNISTILKGRIKMFYLKGNEEDIMKLVKTFEKNPPKDFQKHNCNAPLKKEDYLFLKYIGKKCPQFLLWITLAKTDNQFTIGYTVYNNDDIPTINNYYNEIVSNAFYEVINSDNSLSKITLELL